ncbi:MAG: hypothetical protein AAGF75_07880 [Cyanobacteria bacterium P01_H01_bin.130]
MAWKGDFGILLDRYRWRSLWDQFGAMGDRLEPCRIPGWIPLRETTVER